MDSKSSFIESINNRADAMSNSFPTLDVFRETCLHFLDAIADISESKFAGRDYEVMNRLSELIPLNTDAERLAHTFIQIWFCSNFDSRNWKHLVESNIENVRFAIENALYVFAVSSADGSDDLIRLVRTSNCESVAIKHIAHIGDDDSWPDPWLNAIRDAIAT